MQNCYQNCGNTMAYGRMSGGCGASMVSDCPCYLAIANVPWQYFKNSYEPAKAFMAGTIFPELDKPFLGRSVRK